MVFGDKARGYIDDHGSGIDPALPCRSIRGRTESGSGTPRAAPTPSWGFPICSASCPASGAQLYYRTDLYSRRQAGRGDVDPSVRGMERGPRHLEGDDQLQRGRRPGRRPQGVGPELGPPRAGGGRRVLATEFTPGLPVPTRIEDLVIYELHVGALGYPAKAAREPLGTRWTCCPTWSELGVNAVELLPMSEFSGDFGWGYGDSHHFAIESAPAAGTSTSTSSASATAAASP